MDIRCVNSLVLAYLGDAVYEEYIRDFLIKKKINKVNDLQKESINYVSAKRQAYFLDTFTGFNYPEAKNSIDTYWQNTHTETSYEEVKKRLSKYENAEVIQCNIISEELPLKINNIAVANIDVDMYEAVKVFFTPENNEINALTVFDEPYENETTQITTGEAKEIVSNELNIDSKIVSEELTIIRPNDYFENSTDKNLHKDWILTTENDEYIYVDAIDGDVIGGDCINE